MISTAGIRAISLVSLALAAACGREVDSRPEVAAAVEGSVDGRYENDDEERLAGDRDPARHRYRTHLYSERDADVYSQLDESEGPGTSFVRDIHVEIGDRVGRGSLLATLEGTRQALDVEAARARHDEVAAKAERSRILLEKEMIPPAEHETYENALKEARAALERSQYELGRTRVRAPFAGVVSRRYVRPGERVEADDPLFRVTAMRPLRARFLVPEREIAVFRPGSAVRLIGVDGTRGPGRVLRVAPTVDPASGTREVLVELGDASGFVPGSEVAVQPESSAADRVAEEADSAGAGDR